MISISDGIFAFSITLLVLSLFVPSLGGQQRTSLNLIHALIGERTAFFSYAISFLVITIWWTTHHRLFRNIVRFDGTLIWTNMFFLLFVTIIPFLTELVNQYGDIQAADLIYYFSEIAGAMFLIAAWRHASNGHRLIEKSMAKVQVEVYTVRLYAVPVAFLLAIALTFVTPTWSSLGIVVMVPVSRLLGQRVQKRFEKREGKGLPVDRSPGTSSKDAISDFGLV